MQNQDINIPEYSPKKSKTVSIVITAVITFVLTLVICVTAIIGMLRSSYYPYIVSMLSSDHNDVLGEVRAYIDAGFLYEADEEKLSYGAAKGMVEALGDPYTRYLPPDEFTEYINDGAGNYIGVGIVFTLNDDNEILVVGTYPDSPGDKAGIKSGDILLSVDGTACTWENYDESIAYIRGEHIDIDERAGTSFNLEYLRRDDGSERKNSAELTREVIHVNSVSAQMIDGNIGYITVSSFNNDTHNEFDEAYNDLLSKGMRELIIDLRDNGGGDFNVVIEMAGSFLEKNSLVVYTVDKQDKKTEYRSKEQKYFIKPVILVNGQSASASEVFTGALRDHNAHTAIVGTKTFGKGVTQNVYRMASGGGLIVTVDTYYTPNGDSIHEKGIAPTDIVEIEPPYNEYPASYYTDEIDTQKAYAVSLLKK